MSRYGASTFSSLLKDCVLWAPLQHSAGVSGDVDEFPIIPSGVTVTNAGTFTKTSLGNNKSVLNFNGSNANNISFGSIGTHFAFGTDPMSIAFWFKVISGTEGMAILTRYTTWATNLDIYIYFDPATQYFTCHVLPSTTSPYTIMTTTQTPATDWVHVAFIKKTGGVYESYLNGAYQGTITNSTAQTNNTSTLMISPGSGAIVRSVKDLMIYKGRALTQPEIKLLMNRTHPETGAGLMPVNGEYYRLS